MAMNLNSASSDEMEPMMDINTTPLIDVMLVLIIMLIITIPPQLHAVNLQTPVASSTPPKTEPVVVYIDIEADASLRWNGQPLAHRQALQEQLAQAASWQAPPEVRIRSHAKAPYEAAIAVLAAAQRAGLNRLGMVELARFAN